MPVPDYADKSRPAKQQIADDLRAKIREGIYAVGDQLPPHPELAKEYKVSGQTLRNALDILRQEGIIEGRSTLGTFVRRPPSPEEEPIAVQLANLKVRVDSLEEQVAGIGSHLDHHAGATHAPTSTEDLVTDTASVPEPQPVVAAIVTSHKGVLVGRRHDKVPPWTFIAGEVEPGESPQDAGIREVKEEACLEVRATGIIGRRVHPKTGRTMIYMSAEPVGDLDVVVGDEIELAEVQWVSVEYCEELMQPYGGMFPPVRKYLGRTLLGER